jgi:peptide/nickel transport system permease protein
MMRAPTQPIESRTARLKRSLWLAWDSDLAWSFRHSPVALGASVVALILLTSAMFAHWIAPQNAFDAASLNLMEGFTRPGEASPVTGRVFWLGSDSQGRDVFSAILYGSRVSLLVGFAAVIFSVLLGVSLGLVSGYIGGRTDAFIMRIADIQLSFRRS